MPEIRRVTSVDDVLMAGMTKLMPQLTQAPVPSRELVTKLIGSAENGNRLVAAWQDGEMVGMGCLCVFASPTGVHAHIEDVVVDESQRGKGTGEAIVKALLAEARAQSLQGVSLTCNPRRAAANRLYQRLGFKQWQTNNYWIDL